MRAPSVDPRWDGHLGWRERRPRSATVFLIAGRSTPTNLSLLAAWRRLGVKAAMLRPSEARSRAGEGDVALARLDVLPTLDGVEAGLWELRGLGHLGVRVLNHPGALLTVHDKLATALRLSQVGLPHPRTAHIDGNGDARAIDFPVVVKPRFGSWGRDVVLCRSAGDLERCLRRLRGRGWFRRQGALVQELVPPRGYDLRLLVVRGRVTGAVERLAAPGEWRTNVALGAVRRRVVPPPEACVVAVAAAEAADADFVGVDLLPGFPVGWVVLELNGAVDFSAEYALDGRDVFEEAARLVALDDPATPAFVPAEAKRA